MDQERSDDVDQLLDELLPGEPAESDGVAQWYAEEVPTETDRPATIAKPSAKPVEAPPRRTGFLPIAAVVLGIAVAAVAGYWLGTQRSGDASPASADGASSEAESESESQAEAEPQSAASSDPKAPTASPSTDLPSVAPEQDGDPEQADDPERTDDPVAAAAALESELQSLDLSAIGFVSGSDTLTDDGRTVLSRLAAVLTAQPDVPVEVTVETFTESTPGHNHGLSTLQAQAIVDALIADGVRLSRLAPIGRGSAAERPALGSTALLFDSDDAGLSEDLPVGSNTLAVLGEDGELTAAATANLDAVVAAATAHPESSLTVLGYAFADSRDTSHDQSHIIIDLAADYLVDRGLSADRISTVGMGRAAIDTERETAVTFTVGQPAALSVAIAQIETERIAFEPGTDQLLAGGLEVLEQVAAALALDPTVRIDISAHTYTEADTQANHDLSHRQGDAIVDVLVGVGVDADRLVVVGHGDPPHFAQPGRDAFVTFQPLS